LTVNQRFTAIIQKEDDMFVALCPELDIASQDYSIEVLGNNHVTGQSKVDGM